MTLSVSTAAATAALNASVDAIVAIIDGGSGPATIAVRSGTKPASVATAATGTLLATITLADPSFGAASAGTATGTDPASVTVSATGDPGWFRAFNSSGTAVLDGEVGAGKEMVLSQTTLTAGGALDITSLQLARPAA